LKHTALDRLQVRLNVILFLSKFGCHGNCFCSLENSDIILEFVDPKIRTIYMKNFSISCTEQKLVQFWLILHKSACQGRKS